MKRTLIVAAIATLATGAALAQSSVTVYGRLNITAEALEINGVKSKDLRNNASRLGFKGTEDLGGGLKANFIIEHRFDPTDGRAASPFWAGQSEVNLQGGFGTIRLGQFTSEAYFATADYISMNNHDTGTSADALYGDAAGWAQSNKVGYMSPSFGGLVLHASVAEGSPTTNRAYDLAAVYDLGALNLGFGFQKTGDVKQFAVRGLYTIGAFTVGGYVQRDNDIYASGDRTTYRVTGMYAMGASEFHAAYGAASKYSNVPNSSASQMMVGYNYNLSKRTKVYGYYTKLDSKSGAPYGDLSSLAAGIRHNF